VQAGWMAVANDSTNAFYENIPAYSGCSTS